MKPRFDVYKAVSQQIRAIFAEYTPLIEPLSLDEAYLDVTENLKAMASATEIAEEIRAKIRAETGLTASAGVSYNKFLAKMASDQRKPDGLFVITPKMGPAFVEGLPVGKFHGIGPATSAKMERPRDPHRRRPEARRWRSCRALRQGGPLLLLDLARHRRTAGPRRSHPQIGRRGEHLLGGSLHLRTIVEGAAAADREGVGPLRRIRFRGRTVTLKAKYADFQQVTRSRTCEEPSGPRRRSRRSFRAARAAFPGGKGIRLLGVSLSGLDGTRGNNERQLSMSL